MFLRNSLLVGALAILIPLVTFAAATLFSASPPTINWKKNSVQSLQLTSNASLIFKNGKAGETYKLVVRQDATGGRTIIWPTEVKWSNGIAPSLTSAPNAIDIAEFLFDGTSYFGSFKLNFTGSPPPPPPTTLNDGLIHYWKLDESSGNAMDSVGSMTLTNFSSVSFEPGILGNSSQFDGESSLQYLGTGADLVTSSMPAYSQCSWINVENSDPGLGQAYNYFLSYDANLSFRLTYINESGTIQLRYIHNGALDSVGAASYSTTLPVGEWHHVCVTRSDPGMTLYFDGSAVATGTVAGNNVDLSIGTHIGASIGPSNILEGKVDEVGFWARALSASEVSQLYNGGIGRTYPF